jgi:hypothetical protein
MNRAAWPALQCVARNDFRAAIRIEIRRVDEVDAAVERRLDEVGDVFLAHAGHRRPHAFAAAEGHGAKTHFRDDQSGVAELSESHVLLLPRLGQGCAKYARGHCAP